MSKRIVKLTHELLKLYLKKDMILVDATMGNGHDTIFLSHHVKWVYAFDIQPEAIASTKLKIDALELTNITLIQDSHENILNHVKTFDGVIFNLGYLPGGDQHITTQANVTLKTIDLLLNHLPYHGFIAIVIYPGHPEGMIESLEITKYLSHLDPKMFSILKIDLPFQTNQPPYTYFIEKMPVTK